MATAFTGLVAAGLDARRGANDSLNAVEGTDNELPANIS